MWPRLCSAALIACATGTALPATPKSASRRHQIAYVRYHDSRPLIHIMNSDGTRDRILPRQEGGSSSGPAWAPDGRRIAYEQPDPDTGEARVNISAVDGSSRKVLPVPKREGANYRWTYSPRWSPDGKHLAFVASEEVDEDGYVADDLFVADADGKHPRKINADKTEGVSPWWGRDGRSVGYTRVKENPIQTRGALREIVLAKTDGSGEQVLVSVPEGTDLCTGAAPLSSDGKYLLYVSFAVARGPFLHMMNLSTKEDHEVLLEEPNPENILFPWGPLKARYYPPQFREANWAADEKSFLITLPADEEQGVYHHTGVFRVGISGNGKTRLTPRGVSCEFGVEL